MTGAATVVATTGRGNVLGLESPPPGQPRIARNAHGGKVAQLYVQSLTMPGGELAISASIAPRVLFGIGLTPLGRPFCYSSLGHEWEISFPSEVPQVQLPQGPLLIGGKIALQALSVLASGGSPRPQITPTYTVLETIE